MANHTIMIGPNTRPIAAVPFRCTRKRPIKMMIAAGKTYASRLGAAMVVPSTAASTEIAGVITPSPYSSAAPNSPKITYTHRRPRATGSLPVASADSARIPPSPSLSARITSERYLMVITITSDQNITESRPITFASNSPT